jgi:hypothetical protein
VHGVTGAAFINDWIHLAGGGTSTGGSSGSTIHQVYRPSLGCFGPVEFLDLAASMSPTGQVEVQTVAPPGPVGSTWDIEMLRAEILHDGQELRTAPGSTPEEQLQNSLCFLASVGSFAPGGSVVATDALTELQPGEVVGYLIRATEGAGAALEGFDPRRDLRGVGTCAP